MTTAPTRDDTRLKTLGNGRLVVKAGSHRVFGAWFLDWSILFIASIVTYFALIEYDPLKAILIAAAVWPAGAFLYGLACCYRRSIGQAAAGTRTLRLDNGEVPGFWRSGWVMLVRMVLIPFVFAFFLLSVLSGSPGFGDANDRHLSIDDRATAAL